MLGAKQIEPPHSAAAAFPPSAVRRCKVPRGWLGLCKREVRTTRDQRIAIKLSDAAEDVVELELLEVRVWATAQPMM